MKLFVFALAAAAAALSAVPEAPKSKIAGFPGAPMRLELYGDFTCPHCRMVHEQILPQLMQDYVTPGKAYLVFRDYVLTGAGHQYSRPAATYAAAAARIGRYQTAADALFKAQGAWAISGQIWPSIAASFTPEEQKKIQALVKDPTIATDVQNDIDAGNMVPVQSTPTMVVIYKGKKQPWSMWNSYPLLKNYLDTLLAGK
ncbi:MAG TPA: thioredoxin domain-containing protein [Candidatus Acidoferrum sp.]|jgi:protein-disulfide isomerase|nr:thioredoxin domain-containing protein [Candidatus Acidoferrum sp.]